MTDKAQIYLSALQTGYRIDEYPYTTLGDTLNHVIAPFNMNRIYVHFGNFSKGSVQLYHRMESGLLVYLANLDPETTFTLTMARSYSAPTLEIVAADTGDAGWPISGYGIIKK